MKTRTFILAVLAVGACALTWARAEVSAETDAFKQYIRTVVLTTSSAKNTKIWTVQRARANYIPLNPAGDLNGDLWPVIAETPTIPRTPWVAWSRRTVLDFDLAWSRWDAATAAWTTVASVVVGPSVGNDLDPDIAFSADAQVGQPIEFTTDTLPGRTFTGKVMFINPTIDAASRSAKVVVEVPNADGQLKGGAFVKGRIVTATRPAVLQVPREALLNWNLEQQTADVFIARGDKAEKRVVKTGQSNGVTVEVMSGVEAGDLVVVRGGFSLQPGDRLVIAKGEGA